MTKEEIKEEFGTKKREKSFLKNYCAVYIDCGAIGNLMICYKWKIEQPDAFGLWFNCDTPEPSLKGKFCEI